MATTASMVPIALNTNLLITQLINGLVLGTVLVLFALGLTIIFGLMGIINFAHGDFLLIGAYSAWAVVQLTGSYVQGLIAAIATGILLGLLVERFLIRHIYNKDLAIQVLLTFGLAEFLRGMVQLIWGAQGKLFPVPKWANGTIDFGLFTYPLFQILLLIISLSIITMIYLFLTRTDYGLIIQAGTEDREMVANLGINISRAFLFTFIIGAVLATLAGALVAPVRGVYPTLGINMLLISFVIVIIGGIGSFIGSIIAGVFIGELIVMTSLFFPSLSNIVIFAFLGLFLLVRPEGLLGQEGIME